MILHDCDLCGSPEHQEIAVARHYIDNNEPPVVCMNCGFIYVRERRSPAEIAKSWDDIWGQGYSSDWPAVKARLYYVTEWFDQNFGWSGKSVLDIGAGQGTFLEMVRGRGAYPVAIEPYEKNVDLLRSKDIAVFEGTIEDVELGKHDVVTINWTLENCGDCVGMLKKARAALSPGGVVVVATGSRILVPFKKPLHTYFSKNPADTHAFRFEDLTLMNALFAAGLGPINNNDFRQSDVLLHVAKPSDRPQVNLKKSHAEKVLHFFDRWHREWP